MGIYLPNVEMPKNCAYCPLSEYRNSSILDCKQIGTVGTAFRDNNVLKRRHPNCPLIEVPTPHGRLIDVDKLLEKAYWDYNEATHDYNNFKIVSEYEIADTPTVIEAEGSEE